MWGGETDGKCLKDESCCVGWDVGGFDSTHLITSTAIILQCPDLWQGQASEVGMTQPCCAVWFWQPFLFPFSFSCSRLKSLWGQVMRGRGSWTGQRCAITIPTKYFRKAKATSLSQKQTRRPSPSWSNTCLTTERLRTSRFQHWSRESFSSWWVTSPTCLNHPSFFISIYQANLCKESEDSSWFIYSVWS